MGDARCRALSSPLRSRGDPGTRGEPEPGRAALKHVLHVEKNVKQTQKPPHFQLSAGVLMLPQSCPTPSSQGSHTHPVTGATQSPPRLPHFPTHPRDPVCPLPTPGRNPSQSPAALGQPQKDKQPRGRLPRLGGLSLLLPPAHRGSAGSPQPPAAPVPRPTHRTRTGSSSTRGKLEQSHGCNPALQGGCGRFTGAFQVFIPHLGARGSSQEVPGAAGG